jgi:predicted  nucleic acid-binding Zn-ribbon protein
VSPVVRRVLLALAAIAAGSLVVTGAMRLVERQRTANEISRLRDDLYRARASSDRCRNALANSESALRQLSLTIDSLRSRVDSFEAIDGRGVPANRYDEYLELFDSYNDSVTVWEARERRLRESEASCRETIESHNALSDSLQRVLEEEGIETS